MRNHSQQASLPILQWVALCLAKDPYSLESWYCLRIEPPQGQAIDVAVITVLERSGLAGEGDLLVCPDGTLLLFGLMQERDAMERVGAALCSAWDHDPICYHYDLRKDWHALQEFLVQKLPPESPSPVVLPAAAFGDVAALSEVFAQAKLMRPARQPQYVLLVEDDMLTQHAVAAMLGKRYVVHTAGTAKDAVAKYLQYAPDIVFLDIGLPDASGYCVLRQLLAEDPAAYVVMFTGNNGLESISQALAGGASGYIGKPFKRDKLLHYIDDSQMHHHKEFRA